MSLNEVSSVGGNSYLAVNKKKSSCLCKMSFFGLIRSAESIS